MKSDAKDFNLKNELAKFPLSQEDKIQQVIFDGPYIDYLSQKAEMSTISAGPTSGKTGSQMTANQEKIKFVEYECIKQELKDEYERKITNMNKKFQLKCKNDSGFDLLNKFDSIIEEVENLPTSQRGQKQRVSVTTNNRAKIYPPQGLESSNLNYRVYLDNA